MKKEMLQNQKLLKGNVFTVSRLFLARHSSFAERQCSVESLPFRFDFSQIFDAPPPEIRDSVATFRLNLLCIVEFARLPEQ